LLKAAFLRWLRATALGWVKLGGRGHDDQVAAAVACRLAAAAAVVVNGLVARLAVTGPAEARLLIGRPLMARVVLMAAAPASIRVVRVVIVWVFGAVALVRAAGWAAAIVVIVVACPAPMQGVAAAHAGRFSTALAVSPVIFGVASI